MATEGQQPLLDLPIAQLMVLYDLLRDRILVLERERSVLDDPPRRPLVHIFARPSRQEAHSSSDTFLVCTQEGWWLYNTGDQSQLIFPGRVALEV